LHFTTDTALGGTGVSVRQYNQREESLHCATLGGKV